MSALQEQVPPEDVTQGWKPDPLGGGGVRFWNGTEWTDRVGQETTVATTDTGQALVKKSPDERRAALAQRIQYVVNVDGARVESQTDYQAVVVTGKKVNHVLHLILTLVTLGFWVFVWIGLAIFSGEKRRVITVDEYGQVLG